MSTNHCASCKSKDATKVCSACQDEWYCSQKCQLNAWTSSHKKACKKYDPNELCSFIAHGLIKRIKMEEECRLTFVQFTRGKYALLLRFNNVREGEAMISKGVLNRAAFIETKEECPGILKNYDPEKQFAIVIEVKIPMQVDSFAHFAFAMGIKEEDDFIAN